MTAVEAAEVDPEAAPWALRTRVRYDDQSNFSYTISGPAELLPVIQAGIEAKKAGPRRGCCGCASRHRSAPGVDTTCAQRDS